jgi:hypothetical protein
MKTKFYLGLFVLLFYCVGVYSQRQVIVGVHPYGFANVKYHNDVLKNKFKYSYKSLLGADLGYEYQGNNHSVLTEISFNYGKFDKYEPSGELPVTFNPEQDDDMFSASFSIYYGFTINPRRRIQFPIYIGPFVDYLKSGVIHNVGLGGAAKLRVKFYISNKIGVFVGATGRFGIYLKDDKVDENSPEKAKYREEKASDGYDTDYTINNLTFYPEAGLIFSF